MKEKLKSHFLKFGARPFVVGVVVSLILTDVLNVLFLKDYWVGNNVSYNIAALVAQKQGIDLASFSPENLAELLGMANNFFYFFLFIIMINNLFFYLFYLRKKLWAQSFVLAYALTAALFQLTFIKDSVGMGTGWMMYNLLTIPYYLYVWLGVKLLKHETTIPSGGKAAQ